jgi:hypothetical protein
MHHSEFLLVSEKKVLDLRRFETIIKRCPFCMEDTEQEAHYSHRPDLAVRAMSPTTPSTEVLIRAEEGHPFAWYVIAICSSCSYAYKVMGVPRMKVQLIPSEKEEKSIELALNCCDVCYNEEYIYAVGNVFIRMSEGGSVYLCDAHAEEIDAEKKIKGSYKGLAERMASWKSLEKLPYALDIDGRRIVIRHGKEGVRSLLAMLGERRVAGRAEAERSAGENGPVLLKYLEKEGVLGGRKEGRIIRKESVYLTESGKRAADILLERG